jgi:hypothetical protein
MVPSDFYILDWTVRKLCPTRARPTRVDFQGGRMTEGA